MKLKPQSCWQKARKPLMIAGLFALFVGVIALIFVVVRFYGTGFDGYDKVSTASIINGPSSGTVTRTEEYQPGKSLWDWLQLFIVPAVIALLGVEFTRRQHKRDEQLAKDRDKLEHDIAEDNQREAALQGYIDKIAELLLHEKLRGSAPQDEVQKIAQVRTLTALSRLDGERKRSILQILYTSGLISKNKSIVNLYGANLNDAKLSAANLSGANLIGVDLKKADLSGAILKDANLIGVDLYRADLSGAILSGADLSRATLKEADLFLADLSDANLSEATVTQEQLEQTKSLSGTILPDGPKPP